MICPSSSRRVAKLAGREACMVNSMVVWDQVLRDHAWGAVLSSMHWILESSAMNAVTRRDDYRPAGPHLLQRPFNLPFCLFNLSIVPHHCKKHTHDEKFLKDILRGSNGAPSGCRRRAAVHHACRGVLVSEPTDLG